MKLMSSSKLSGWIILAAGMLLTVVVYSHGLYGAFLFDDYPNIVDNQGVQPRDASLGSLAAAAFSSPSSEFKRPLASLSFAANYLATGLDPYWMKLTNLVIHLLNGLLVFLLAKALLRAGLKEPLGKPSLVPDGAAFTVHLKGASVSDGEARQPAENHTPSVHASLVAALIATSWLLLPINLTGVLYVVQRMESMANLFVLAGLLGYVIGRRCMLAGKRGFLLCTASLIVPTAIGLLAKETAVMLPLYACLVEWALFRFRGADLIGSGNDRRLWLLFAVVLFLPMIAGVAWLLPGVLSPGAFSGRDFTLTERVLSEPRIILDYIVWTLIPTPHALSFYHDDYHVSHGLLTPWTTLASIVLLGMLVAAVVVLRRRAPLVALGLALFLGAQILTGTLLPLELVYEHRNYFASFGLLLALVPILAAPRTVPFALPRHALLAGLMLCWTALTALTAYAWGNPLRLAEDLAMRAPQSPRAQYEQGRAYIIYSHYDPASPFTQLAYAPLERAAALPDASILPEQALIFMNARMQLPLKNSWWNSMIAKLKARKPGVQDESSLGALTQCARELRCNLPKSHMKEAFMAALAHPSPNARLLATYGDYAWNVLEDHDLGERMTKEAVKASPSEPAYQITLIRMFAAQGRKTDATEALRRLDELNIGGRLNGSLSELRALPGLQ